MMNFKILLFLLVVTFVESSEFYKPWENNDSAIIIDPYRYNNITWNELKKDTRVVAIIHKATEGLKIDNKYNERKKEAKKRGYLWGSYHLGRPGNPIEQAKKYLAIANPSNEELTALDLESISADYMSLENARKFIEYIAKETKRYPALYINHSTTKKINDLIKKDDVFSKCILWYARFRKNIPKFPKGTWSTYTIWQFSSEINCKTQNKCLYNVPGTRFDMDINVYNGSIQQLREKWPLTNKVK